MSVVLYSLGAAQEVTGSKHIFEVDGRSFMIDCGAFQGKRAESDEKNREFDIAVDKTEYGQRDAIKLAYANSLADAQKDGVAEGTRYTTGTWEYMTVPAITPPQGGDPKFQQVCLDFDSDGLPVIGYLGTYLEFGKEYPEE